MTSQDISPERRLPEQPPSGETAPAPAPFADPGPPPHRPRRQDIDERAAKRSERTVALLFTIATLATIGFIAAYVAIPKGKIVYLWPLGHLSASNFTLGVTLGIALLCIGAGAVHWARTLMSDVEIAEERHPIAARDEVRQRAFGDFRKGAEESGFGRYKMLRRTLFGALALVPLTGLVLLRDLGPLPGDKLRHTLWAKGKLLINVNTGQPMRPADLIVGSLAFAQPQGLQQASEDYNKEIAKAALLLVRLNPGDIKDRQQLAKSYDGIVAFSKICTHVGSPVSLYERTTHKVMCPCHQSTFDLTDGGRVTFGPAGHALPQLRIGVNRKGYLQALGDFDEPVGPSFWERA